VSGEILLGAGRPLVLASASPRRRQLLTGLGVRFEVQVADVDETLTPGLGPEDAAVDVALRKAWAVARRGGMGLIVAADTLVLVDGESLAKPADDAEARTMLRRLRGRKHDVITGVVVLRVEDGTAFTGAAVTNVEFEAFDDAVLDALVATGDHEGKAGAYAIQGMAGPLVKRLDGDYFNVVGLPLNLLRRLLREATT